jgi:hypothetical protein
MNSSVQTRSRMPESLDAMPSTRRIPDVSDVESCGMGSQNSLELAVIARFPDVDAQAPRPKHTHRHRSRPEKIIKPPVTGRMINANLSLNILLGLGVVLLLGAIAPYIFDKFTGNSSSKNNTDLAWQLHAPAPTADLAPAWKPPSEKTPATAPAGFGSSESPLQTQGLPVQPQTTMPPPDMPTNDTLAAYVKPNMDTPNGKSAAAVSAVASVPRQDKAEPYPVDAMQETSPWPRAAADQANFSAWPHPAHPIARNDIQGYAQSPSGEKYSSAKTDDAATAANRSMTLGDYRPGGTGNQPGIRSYEQNNSRFGAPTAPRQNEPLTADRSTYDSSRPSVH